MSESPLPGVLRFAAPLLASAYGRIIAARNAQFDARQGVVEIDRPVISVGNLSVGGTGKSPMVAWVVRALVRAGHRPVIAMRGYSKGGQSDEAEEYRATLDGVAVVARPDRLEGLIEHFASPEGNATDCVVLDDGFQHRRIGRRLDLVLVDATRDPFTDRLLPAGWLREPVDSLRRAGAIVLTHAESVPTSDLVRIRQAVTGAFPRTPIAISRHAWTGLERSDESGVHQEAVSWLRGKRVIAACGIGNPQPFLKSVAAAAGNPPIEFVRPDHDPFVPRTLEALIRLAKQKSVDAIVVTGKDWAKLKRVRPDAWPCPVVRACLQISFDDGADALEQAVLVAAAGRAGDASVDPGRGGDPDRE